MYSIRQFETRRARHLPNVWTFGAGRYGNPRQPSAVLRPYAQTGVAEELLSPSKGVRLKRIIRTCIDLEKNI